MVLSHEVSFPMIWLFHCNFQLIEHSKDDFMQVGFPFSTSVGKRYDSKFLSSFLEIFNLFVLKEHFNC